MCFLFLVRWCYMREGGEGSGRIPWDSGHVLAFMVVMCDNDDHDVVRVIMMTMMIV